MIHFLTPSQHLQVNKTLLFSLLLFIQAQLLTAQSTTTILKEKSLIKGQTIYLNSKARLGGKNRIVIPVQLPANTIAWSYSFSTVATSNANQQVQSAGLEMQIARLIANGALNILKAGLVTNVASQLIKPTGSGSVDIYLTDANGLKQFEQKDIVGLYTNDVPAFYREGTAQNSRNGVFQIPIVRNDLFLCLRNPSVTEGVAISVDLVAIVSTKEYSDVWSFKNIESLYNDCLIKFSIKDSEAEKICDCAKNNIKDSYKPSYFLGLSNAEKDVIIRKNIKPCSDETGSSNIVNKDNRLKDIMQLITGQNITKDHAGAAESYKELLALEDKSWQVYNGLAFHQLCLGQFEEAKKNLTMGIGKSPEDLYLLKNLGNYYLLTDKYNQAIEILSKYKNKKLKDKQKFKDAVSEDLKEFERLGYGNIYFERVRKDLKID